MRLLIPLMLSSRIKIGEAKGDRIEIDGKTYRFTGFIRGNGNDQIILAVMDEV